MSLGEKKGELVEACYRAIKATYTELRTPFIFSSNTHLFKGTEGHFYQFRKKHLIFWVITNCTFVLFQGKAFNFLSNYK